MNEDTEAQGYRLDNQGKVSHYTCDDCNTWVSVTDMINIGEVAEWLICPLCLKRRHDAVICIGCKHKPAASETDWYCLDCIHRHADIVLAAMENARGEQPTR